MAGTKRDVFFCHASEDKDEVVRPLVEACNESDISCWYDEAEIQWGDSITQKVNDGLARSLYVVVVLSPSFANKNWPERELNAVLNQEASTGDVKVLPLLVGSEQEKQQILKKYPLLNDKRYRPWDGDHRGVISELRTRLNKSGNRFPGQSEKNIPTSEFRIPLPNVQRRFTQRDKDIFVRQSFVVVKHYFQSALQEIERRFQEMETDFEEVHNLKFISKIYVRGDVKKCCKIWRGGFNSSDAIAYYEGHSIHDTDNSLNEMLSIVDDATSLGFRPSFGMMSGGRHGTDDEPMSAEKAGEYLWLRFIDNLG